jgi:hypothetical protein
MNAQAGIKNLIDRMEVLNNELTEKEARVTAICKEMDVLDKELERLLKQSGEDY